MKDYQVYIFDMDLTLLDTVECSALCYENAFKAIGLTFDKNTTVYHLARSLRLSYNELENPQGSYEDFLKGYIEISYKAMKEKAKFYDDALIYINYLIKQKKTLAIVTNRAQEEILTCLKKAGLENAFKVIMTCDKVNKLKPDPEAINKCIEELKADKNDCVYIGDALNDYKAATNANIDYIDVERYKNGDFIENNKVHLLTELIK